MNERPTSPARPAVLRLVSAGSQKTIDNQRRYIEAQAAQKRTQLLLPHQQKLQDIKVWLVNRVVPQLPELDGLLSFLTVRPSRILFIDIGGTQAVFKLLELANTSSQQEQMIVKLVTITKLLLNERAGLQSALKSGTSVQVLLQTLFTYQQSDEISAKCLYIISSVSTLPLSYSSVPTVVDSLDYLAAIAKQQRFGQLLQLMRRFSSETDSEFKYEKLAYLYLVMRSLTAPEQNPSVQARQEIRAQQNEAGLDDLTTQVIRECVDYAKKEATDHQLPVSIVLKLQKHTPSLSDLDAISKATKSESFVFSMIRFITSYQKNLLRDEQLAQNVDCTEINVFSPEIFNHIFNNTLSNNHSQRGNFALFCQNLFFISNIQYKDAWEHSFYVLMKVSQNIASFCEEVQKEGIEEALKNISEISFQEEITGNPTKLLKQIEKLTGKSAEELTQSGKKLKLVNQEEFDDYDKMNQIVKEKEYVIGRMEAGTRDLVKQNSQLQEEIQRLKLEIQKLQAEGQHTKIEQKQLIQQSLKPTEASDTAISKASENQTIVKDSPVISEQILQKPTVQLPPPPKLQSQQIDQNQDTPPQVGKLPPPPGARDEISQNIQSKLPPPPSQHTVPLGQGKPSTRSLPPPPGRQPNQSSHLPPPPNATLVQQNFIDIQPAQQSQLEQKILFSLPPPPDSKQQASGLPPPPNAKQGLPPPPGTQNGLPPPPTSGVQAPVQQQVIGQQKIKKQEINKPAIPLKIFHWDKIRDNEIKQGTIWHEIGIEDIRFPPSIMQKIQDAFAVKREVSASAAEAAKLAEAKKAQAVSLEVLDAKKAQSINIALQKLKLTPVEVVNRVIQMKDLTELDIEILCSCIPKDQEVDAVRVQAASHPIEQFARPERYIIQTLTVPNYEKRLKFWKYMKSFYFQLLTFKPDFMANLRFFDTLLKNKRFFMLLRYMLSMGNCINGGNAKGCALGFHVKTLSKFCETKDSGGERSIMAHVVEIARYFDDKQQQPTEQTEQAVQYLSCLNEDQNTDCDPCSEIAYPSYQIVDELLLLNKRLLRTAFDEESADFDAFRSTAIEMQSTASAIKTGRDDDNYELEVQTFLEGAAAQLNETYQIRNAVNAKFAECLRFYVMDGKTKMEEFLQLVNCFIEQLAPIKAEQDKEALKEAQRRKKHQQELELSRQSEELEKSRSIRGVKNLTAKFSKPATDDQVIDSLMQGLVRQKD